MIIYQNSKIYLHFQQWFVQFDQDANFDKQNERQFNLNCKLCLKCKTNFSNQKHKKHDLQKY